MHFLEAGVLKCAVAFQPTSRAACTRDRIAAPQRMSPRLMNRIRLLMVDDSSALRKTPVKLPVSPRDVP